VICASVCVCQSSVNACECMLLSVNYYASLIIYLVILKKEVVEYSYVIVGYLLLLNTLLLNRV